MDRPFFQAILEEASQYAQGGPAPVQRRSSMLIWRRTANVPSAVKDEVMKKIREFVQAQFEK